MSYAEQSRRQKPLSMAAAIALNGAIITAVILSPMVAGPIERKTTTDIFNVRPTPPPEPPKANKIEPRPFNPVFTPPTPVPQPLPENPIRTVDEPTLPNPGIIEGSGGGVELGKPPIVETPPPLFKHAARDPRYERDFQPDYPSTLLVRGIEGKATLRVLVGTDGRVREAIVVSASHPDFGKAAVRQALRAWRFKPATRGGSPVEDWVTLPVSFVIT